MLPVSNIIVWTLELRARVLITIYISYKIYVYAYLIWIVLLFCPSLPGSYQVLRYISGKAWASFRLIDFLAYLKRGTRSRSSRTSLYGRGFSFVSVYQFIILPSEALPECRAQRAAILPHILTRTKAQTSWRRCGLWLWSRQAWLLLESTFEWK